VTAAPLPRRLWRRLVKFIENARFFDQWTVMVAAGEELRDDFSGFRRLVPPRDRYWADPFVIQREDRYYVFIEEKVRAEGLGHIACLTLDPDGEILARQSVLQKPYHLSYPFIFDYQGELYMLPESAQNRTLDLFRCVRFPDQWEYAATLIRGLHLVDATLLEHEGKWWMFANLKEEGGSSWDQLHLFYADSPLSAAWEAHPRNPIVADIRSARPAGRIFRRGGVLIRPSQDCSRRYGYALQFNRIQTLDEHSYAETRESSLRPAKDSEIIAAHTWNAAGGLTVIDALIRRPKSAN
jgi:hypothetical protein